MKLFSRATETVTSLSEERSTLDYLRTLEEFLEKLRVDFEILALIRDGWLPHTLKTLQEVEAYVRIIEEKEAIEESLREAFHELKGHITGLTPPFDDKKFREANKLLKQLRESVEELSHKVEAKIIKIEANFRTFLESSRRLSWNILIVAMIFTTILAYLIVKEHMKTSLAIVNHLKNITSQIKSNSFPVIPPPLKAMLPEGEKIAEYINELVNQHNISLKRIRELSEAKTAFLAIASHETKTPLTSIIGYSEILLEEDIPPKLKEKLTIIRSQAQTLLKTMERMLSYSRLGSDINLSKVNLRELLEKVGMEFVEKAREKGIDFKINILSNNTTIETDPYRLEIALREILDNAFKFAQNGYIELTLKIIKDRAIIAVKDSGPGIEEDKKDMIFELFYQGEGFLTRKHSGLGLGLPLALRAINGIGKITFKSQKGKGNTFYIILYGGGILSWSSSRENSKP